VVLGPIILFIQLTDMYGRTEIQSGVLTDDFQ